MKSRSSPWTGGGLHGSLTHWARPAPRELWCPQAASAPALGSGPRRAMPLPTALIPASEGANPPTSLSVAAGRLWEAGCLLAAWGGDPRWDARAHAPTPLSRPAPPALTPSSLGFLGWSPWPQAPSSPSGCVGLCLLPRRPPPARLTPCSPRPFILAFVCSPGRGGYARVLPARPQFPASTPRPAPLRWGRDGALPNSWPSLPTR